MLRRKSEYLIKVHILTVETRKARSITSNTS
jgi:hypothetical protein